MSSRRTGYDMVLDLMRKALDHLEAGDARSDAHVTKARALLDDALYLAELNKAALK